MNFFNYKMVPELPEGIRFQKGPRGKKYTAILPNGKRVHFGASNYEQYKDSVPKNLGGQLWSHKNHLDEDRKNLIELDMELKAIIK